MPPDVFKLKLTSCPGFSGEAVWALWLDASHAKILSVVRYSTEAQYGDVVLYEGDHMVGITRAGGFVMHRVCGGPTPIAKAMQLHDQLRELDLCIEVWSLTMRGDDPAENALLRAGLAIQPQDTQKAAQALEGRGLYYPTLLAAAGDELGARRHKKELAR